MRRILEKFSEVKILVIGDAMIDRFWWGSVTRISPEAPVPVVRLDKEILKAGGAANVAANVASLGAIPKLICGVGDDEAGKAFPRILEKADVPSDQVEIMDGRRTTLKTRIVAHNQHVVRIDSETPFQLTEEEERCVLETFQASVIDTDVVIVSDYAKGFLNDKLLKRLITTGRKYHKIILVDPKGNDYKKYKNATVLTPNRAETAQAARTKLEGAESISTAAKFLLESLALRAVLVTEGENGMSLFERDAEPHRLAATARSVYDVTGAGDTVIAALAVALGSGANLKQAAEIANVAAGLVVQEVGTSVVNYERLEKILLS